MDSGNPLANRKYNFESCGDREYLRFFRSLKPGDLTLDSTTHYFYQQTAMEQFAKMGTKVCVVLREPTARLVSYFQYVCMTRDAVSKPICFGEFIHDLLKNDVERFRENFVEEREFFSLQTSLTQGYYADYLQKWQANFRKSDLLVMLFEDLIADQETQLRRVVDFFCIPVGPGHPMQLFKDNETYKAKYPRLNRLARSASRLIQNERIKRPIRRIYVKYQKSEMSDLYSQYPDEIELLRDHYAEHIKRFGEVSGINLARWDSCQQKKAD